jgi:hypothetical protein
MGWSVALPGPRRRFHHEDGGEAFVFSATPVKVLAFAKGTLARPGTGLALIARICTGSAADNG